MNIDALLPLLLKGSDNAEVLKLLTAIRSGDKVKAIESLLPEDKKNDQIINLIRMTEKQKPPVAGLGAIEGFCSNEILGIMVRVYS